MPSGFVTPHVRPSSFDSVMRKGWHHGGQHQSGSCRMGSDPKQSVTDKWARVWDFPNFFIADGSVQVSNGGMNPVLTIMALAFCTLCGKMLIDRTRATW